MNGFPLGGSCQRPRPRTDEGRPCRNNPFTGGNGGLCPHPACGHLPPKGNKTSVNHNIVTYYRYVFYSRLYRIQHFYYLGFFLVCYNLIEMANVVIEVITWCHVECRRTVRIFFSRNKRQFRIFSIIHQCCTIFFCAIYIFLIESVSFQRFNHTILHIRNGNLINRRFRIRHIQTHRCIVSKACFYIYDISNITIMEEQGKVVFVYC